MCEYCKICYDKKINSTEVLYFEQEGLSPRAVAIFNIKSKGAVLSLLKEKSYYDWLDLQINYCPMCGKKLRKRKLWKKIKF